MQAGKDDISYAHTPMKTLYNGTFMKSTYFFLSLLLFIAPSANGNGVNTSDSWHHGAILGPGVDIAKTDFCDVLHNRNKSIAIDLEKVLAGRNLSIAIQYGPGFDFFQFNPDEEYSSTNPGGMMADILDELANRAGFAWRDSFVVYDSTTADTIAGKGDGKWDRMLKKSIANVDLSVDKWCVHFYIRQGFQFESQFLMACIYVEGL